jgi:hypothetical protein
VTSAAVTAATKPLPRPRAIDGAVENDIFNRTLIVRRPKHIAGYEAFMWRQAHEHLVNAEERGWYNSDAYVRCSTSGHPDIVSATPRCESDITVSLSGRHTSREGLHRNGQ